MGDRRFFNDIDIEGLPRAQVLGIKRERLRRQLEYVARHSAFYRRTFAEAGVDPAKVEHLEDLPLLPFTETASSASRFYRTLEAQGLAVARDTLYQLPGHLEDCFLVHLVRLPWLEATSERQRMVHPRKVHPVDPGLIPVFGRSGKAHLGRNRSGLRPKYWGLSQNGGHS
jgi:hypothetical protein